MTRMPGEPVRSPGFVMPVSETASKTQMKSSTWDDAELLPCHDQDDWAIWDSGESTVVDEQELARRLNRWQPQSVVLVGEPRAKRFEIPVMIASVASIAQASAVRRLRQSVIVCSVLAAVFALLQVSQKAESLLLWSYSFASLALIFAVDLYGPMRSSKGIDERARFLYWLKVSPSARLGIFFWSALGITAGVLQYSLAQSDGIVAVFDAYGFVYERFEAGEYWRVLTGAYLHYSLMHFVPNLFLLMLIGMLAFPTVGPVISVVTFVLGNAAGLIGQIYLGGSLYDSSGGISFGIYALFGLVVMSAILQPRLMPRSFNVLCALIAILALAISEITSPAAATAGHITGLAVGILAVLARGVCRKFSSSGAAVESS